MSSNEVSEKKGSDRDPEDAPEAAPNQQLAAQAKNHTSTTTSNNKKRKKKKKRKSNNIRRDNSGSKSNKRRKPNEKFWIEDCSDSVMPPSACQNTQTGDPAVAVAMANNDVPFLELLITRSTLTDDYRHPPASKPTMSLQQAEALGDNVAELFNRMNKDADDIKVGSTSKAHDAADHHTEAAKDDTEAIKKAPSSTCKLQPPEPFSSTYSKATANATIDPSKAFICVKRANSAKQPMIWDHDKSIENFKPLPNGDCGDGIVNPYPKHIVPDKFWSQRHRLFTKFNEGIQLDPESWFSVTPEIIANHIAAHLVGNRRLDIDDEEDKSDNKKLIVMDPFGGCGGNSIAFARRDEVKLVISVDLDLEKLKMAASNAAIYGIPKHKLVFVHDNGCRVMSSFDSGKLKERQEEEQPPLESSGYQIGGLELLPDRVDCIFLSPPWGGIDYGECGKRNYTLQHIQVDGVAEGDKNIDGEEILKFAAKAVGTRGPIAYFVPKNTNGIQFGRSVLKAGCVGEPVVMEQNVLNGKLKTITAYVGL